MFKNRIEWVWAKTNVHYPKLETNNEDNADIVFVGDDQHVSENEDFDTAEPEETDDNIKINPQIGEFWRVENNGSLLYVVVESVEADVIGVKFFKAEPPKDSGNYSLSDRPWTISPENLDKRVPPPKTKGQGRRTFYTFEDEEYMV